MKNTKYDIVWVVTIAAALVTVVRYSAAFISSDMGQITGNLSEGITFAMGLTGLGMGILDVFGGAYLFNGWRKTMPKTGQNWSFKFKSLTAFVFGLVISGMTILIPFTISRITQSSIANVLGRGWGMWVWSGMVNIVPYFLVGGVFTGNSVLKEEIQEKVSGNLLENKESDEKVSGKLPVNWRKLRPQLSPEQVNFIAKNEPRNIVKSFLDSGFNVTPRTASNWRTYAMEELGLSLA